VDFGGGNDGRPHRRRGALTLLAWYSGAVLAPIALGVALLGPGFLRDGSSSELIQPCDDPMECGPLFPDASMVLQAVLPFLAVSLLVALPLYGVFTRLRWSPVRAGSAAALLAWLVCLVGACLLYTVRSRAT
jgi:hypothetical protein